jgi:hypothetical protein
MLHSESVTVATKIRVMLCNLAIYKQAYYCVYLHDIAKL